MNSQLMHDIEAPLYCLNGPFRFPSAAKSDNTDLAILFPSPERLLLYAGLQGGRDTQNTVFTAATQFGLVECDVKEQFLIAEEISGIAYSTALLYELSVQTILREAEQLRNGKNIPVAFGFLGRFFDMVFVHSDPPVSRVMNYNNWKQTVSLGQFRVL
jgi:hypothetical protein